MFSGIVDASAQVTEVIAKGPLLTLAVDKPDHYTDCQVNDSIAVNGVCLTITNVDGGQFYFDCVPETLARTSMAQLKAGSWVNLERAMCMSDRIGGHLIQGHVDGTARVLSVESLAESKQIIFACDDALHQQLFPKGYIAIDGMSITVASLHADHFGCALIPHTLSHTIAGNYQVGTTVNIEIDWMSKQMFQAMKHFNQHKGVS